MSGSKRRGDNTVPALFPFLAVLLCTVGALVLILVLTVTNSYASAKRDVENAMTDIKDTSDLMQVVSEELEAQREGLKSKVERRRRDLADIEDHISRLTKTLNQLGDKIERIQTEDSTTEADRSGKTDEVAELRKEIDQKKRELIDEIDKQKKRKPAFAIIPYIGSNGTSRRPVYLECTKDGIIVQPEGLLISLNDLKPPFGPGNPLDAALRVLRLTYQQKDVTFGISQPPYPLLVIRPDGSQSFALAREAMSGWDDQYGYELVDNEMELKFPPSPAGLKEQLSTTIEIAKRRQKALIASMPRRVVQPDSEEGWDVIDASNSTQQSGGSNSLGSRDNIASEAGSSTVLSAGNGTQQNWQLIQGMANSQVSGAIQKNGLESSQSVGASGKPGLTGNPSGAPNPNAFSMGVADLNGQTLSEGQFNSDAGSKVASNAGDSQGSASSAAGTQGGRGSSTGVASQSGTHADSNSTGSQALSNAPTSPGANAFSSGTATGGGAGSMSAFGSPSQTPADPNVTPNVSLTMNQKAESQPAKAKHVRAEGDLKPISVSAGHGWAASRAEGKATPVSRSIHIVALKDKWLLRSDVDRNIFEVSMNMDEGPQQAGNQLAVAMRKRVDSWGLSVLGGYWSPTLTIEAANDAQQSVARLERLLEGSGVEIKVVPLTLPNRR